jgi:transposase-like protein
VDNDSLLSAFADELAAHRYLEGLLWPKGPVCPHCSGLGRVRTLDGGSTRIGARKCYACRRIFSITYGTIFQRSHVPLHKWLQAIYLTDGGSTTMRPFHLAKIIGVSNKTAVAMLLRLGRARRLVRGEPIQPGGATATTVFDVQAPGSLSRSLAELAGAR